MAKLKVNKVAVLAGAAGLMVAAGVAHGQNAGATRPSREPVMVGSNDVVYTEAGVRLVGDAEILQGDNRLRANVVEARANAGQISQVEASGEVYFVTPTQTIRADRAVYVLSNATVTASGDVILTQGENVLTGGSLTYNVDTGEARMTGAPVAGAGNRVQGVFYPEGN